MGTPRPEAAGLDAVNGAADQDHHYAAFISYRHTEPDRRWARWLHSALETYRVPARLRRQRNLPLRVGRVFRDEEELPASSDLSSEVERALRQSRFLVVICSPNTPASQWVNREVQRFRELGRGDRILAVLVAGEPAESFPRSLREIRRTLAEGRGVAGQRVEEVEPLAADVRPVPGEGGHTRQHAKLRVLAALLGVRFDDLRQREQERRLRRVAGVAAAAVVLGAVLAGLAGFAFVQRGRAAAGEAAAVARKAEAEGQRAVAVAKQAEAEAARRKEAEAAETARLELYYGTITLADTVAKSGDHVRAAELLDSCPPDLRQWEWHYLRRTVRDDSTVIRTAKPASGVCFSPRSDLLAIAAGQRVEVWDFNNRPAARLAAGDRTEDVTAIAFDARGGQLAIATRGNGVALADPRSLRDVARLASAPKEVTAFAFAPDGAWLACLSGTGDVAVLDLPSGKLLRTLPGGDSVAVSLAMSDDGQFLATGCKGDGRKVRIWRAATGELAHAHANGVLYQSEPLGLAFQPGGGAFTYATRDGVIGVRDRTSGAVVWTASVPSRMALGLARAGDGSALLVAHEVGAILIDPRAGTPTSKLVSTYDRQSARCPAVSRNGRLAAAAFDDGVRVWATAATTANGSGRPVDDYAAGVSSVAVHPVSGRLALGRRNAAPVVVDPDGAVHPFVSGRQGNDVLAAFMWSPSGHQLAYPAKDVLAVYDVAAGTEAGAFPLPARVGALAQNARRSVFADGGRVLLMSTDEGRLVAWDLASNQQLWNDTPPGGARMSAELLIPPDDDRQILVSRRPERATVRDARTGSVVRELADGFPTHALVFTPDRRTVYGVRNGRLVASAWPSGSTTEMGSLPARVDSHAAAMSPDGRRLATGFTDRTVRVWEPTTGRVVLSLVNCPFEVTSLAWSVDGGTLWGAGAGGGLLTWRGGTPVPGPRRTLNLLAACRPSDGIEGDWRASGGVLVGSATGGFVVMAAPARVWGAYRLEAQLVRRSGSGSVAVILPINGRFGAVEIGGYPGFGYLSGMHTIDGRSMTDRPGDSIRGLEIETGQPIRVTAEVTPMGPLVTIRADVNGRQIVDWTGPASRLSTPGKFLAPADTPAIFGYAGEFEVGQFTLTAEEGQYEFQGSRAPAARKVAGPGDALDLLPAGGGVPERSGGVSERSGGVSAGGAWEPVSGGGFRLVAETNGFARVGFPVHVRGSYELIARFRRAEGEAQVDLILPHPGGQVAAEFDNRGGHSGLARVLDLASDQQGYTGPDPGRVLGVGRTHEVIMRVEPVGIADVRFTCRLDGRQLYAWQTPASAVKLSSNWTLRDPAWVGVGTRGGINGPAAVVFERLELRVLDGDATLLINARACPAATVSAVLALRI